MPPPLGPSSALQLDPIIRAYEAAQVRDGQADLVPFLPPEGHALRREALRELIRVDLEYGWERGRPRRLEEYQELFPELQGDLTGLHDIAYEEYRLRLQAGQRPAPEEYERRFGLVASSWPRPGRTTLPEDDHGRACDAERLARNGRPRAGDPLTLRTARYPGLDGHAESVSRTDNTPAAGWPEVGTRFLDFELLDELGRGAFARVYLARQAELANRLVALKVSPRLPGEPHALAQLQHTHIVPVYSVHRTGRWQAVCMPYFGPTTLADVLKTLEGRAAPPASGQELVETLDARKSSPHLSTENPDREKGDAPTQGPSAASSRRPSAAAALRPTHLAGLTYVEAVLWLGARLADGLAHAHQRGILHRDLKPANVLLTDDGQPMLLDFNLAQDIKAGSPDVAAGIGGTLPYMAPEHLEAFRGGGALVDARSDLYALGVILYELLTGRHPFPARHGPLKTLIPELLADRSHAPPRPRAGNPAVTPAAESIVRRCLEPEPAKRYQAARDLREDLQRQLEHLPLQHAPEPSLAERLRKWRRRHPRLSSSGTVAAVALVLLLGVSGYFLSGHLQLSSEKDELDRWGTAEAVRQFREEVKTIRYLLLAPDVGPGQREEGLLLAQNVFTRFHVLGDEEWKGRAPFRSLPEADQQWVRAHVGELLLHKARLLLRQAGTADEVRRREQADEALRLNHLAEQCYAPELVPPAVWLQRAASHRLRGAANDEDVAADLEKRAAQTAWDARRDQYLLLWDYLDRGRPPEWLELFEGPPHDAPYSALLWLLLGDCQADLGQSADALASYNLAVTYQPDVVWTYFRRGVLRLDRHEYRDAAADFDHFLRKREDPTAYLHRALARIGLRDFAGARQDLAEAMRECEPSARTLLTRAVVRERLGDLEGARRDKDAGVNKKPRDAADRVAIGAALLPDDPDGALEEFESALALNPHLRPALEYKARVLADYLERPAEAVALLGRIIESHPEFGSARAERGVLRARLGEREAAHADAEAALRHDPRPEVHYRVARLYAVTSRHHLEDRRTALRHLATALSQGHDGERLTTDRDLEPLREDAEFRRLVEAAGTLRAGAGTADGQ